MDEKQFRSGHQYITNLLDLEQGRILDVVEERKEVSCKTLLETALTPDQREQVTNEGDSRLKGTKHWWLYNGDNVKHAHNEPFKTLKHSNLKVARSWAIKEQFRGFWGYRSQGWARRYFERWYSWAIRCRLAPVKKVAKMLKSHLNGLLNYFHHRISNAVAEGLNSKIQTVKSNARGYRSFDGFRTSILFNCGKLDMLP
jgi:transposase